MLLLFIFVLVKFSMLSVYQFVHILLSVYQFLNIILNILLSVYLLCKRVVIEG